MFSEITCCFSSRRYTMIILLTVPLLFMGCQELSWFLQIFPSELCFLSSLPLIPPAATWQCLAPTCHLSTLYLHCIAGIDCLPIWWERFLETQQEDKCGPLINTSSLNLPLPILPYAHSVFYMKGYILLIHIMGETVTDRYSQKVRISFSQNGFYSAFKVYNKQTWHLKTVKSNPKSVFQTSWQLPKSYKMKPF